jgi:hypothetical protein
MLGTASKMKLTRKRNRDLGALQQRRAIVHDVQTRGFECTIAAASFARTGALLREHSARIVLDPSIILRVSEDLHESCSPHGHFRIEPMTSSMPWKCQKAKLLTLNQLETGITGKTGLLGGLSHKL